jgi:hypothetical protein
MRHRIVHSITLLPFVVLPRRLQGVVTVMGLILPRQNLSCRTASLIKFLALIAIGPSWSNLSFSVPTFVCFPPAVSNGVFKLFPICRLRYDINICPRALLLPSQDPDPDPFAVRNLIQE